MTEHASLHLSFTLFIGSREVDLFPFQEKNTIAISQTDHEALSLSLIQHTTNHLLISCALLFPVLLCVLEQRVNSLCLPSFKWLIGPIRRGERDDKREKSYQVLEISLLVC
jgi:hypothetical protein